MSWQGVVVVAVVLAGLGAGAYLAARHPAFWIELGRRLVVALLPYLIAYITKRMSPGQEAEFQKSIRQGREWDPFRKRTRDR